MADATIDGLPTIASVDRAADKLAIWDNSDSLTGEMTINAMLGFSGGNPVSTSDTQTLTNKTLTSPTITVLDNVFTVQDNSDNTKQLQLQLSGITTGTTRTLTVPDANTTIVGTDATQTLTNKTLTSPTINGGTIDNPTLTIDTISEDTSGNGVTIDGLSIKDSKLNTNDSVVTANITDGAVTPAKLVSGAGTGWGWTSWVPTYNNFTLGNGTIEYAKYAQTGKTVNLRLKIILGTTSSVSGLIGISLPVTANADLNDGNDMPLANGQYFDATGNRWIPIVRFGSTSRMDLFYANTSANHANTSSTAPFTWADTDFIEINITYEAA